MRIVAPCVTVKISELNWVYVVKVNTCILSYIFIKLWVITAQIARLLLTIGILLWICLVALFVHFLPNYSCCHYSLLGNRWLVSIIPFQRKSWCHTLSQRLSQSARSSVTTPTSFGTVYCLLHPLYLFSPYFSSLFTLNGPCEWI